MTEMNKRFAWRADVRHCTFDSEEAQSIAAVLGLQASTAKEVAVLLDQPMDKEKINKLCFGTDVDLKSEWAEFNDCNWTQELDREIRPYQEKAREVGILMTPILVVDGEVLWEGSVPDKKTLYGVLGIE
jgi:hypothetical protein